MEIAGMITARNGGTRFPGKESALLYGRPMIEWIIEKLQTLPIDPIVVCTSRNVEDDILNEIADRNGVKCFRGPDHDLLTRQLGCFEYYGFGISVHVSGDSPFFDPRITEKLIESAQDNPGFDQYLPRPVDCPIGGDASGVWCLPMLRKAEALLKDHPARSRMEEFWWTVFLDGKQPVTHWTVCDEYFPREKTPPKTSIDYPLELAMWNQIIEKMGHFPESYQDIMTAFETIHFL